MSTYNKFGKSIPYLSKIQTNQNTFHRTGNNENKQLSLKLSKLQEDNIRRDNQQKSSLKNSRFQQKNSDQLPPSKERTKQHQKLNSANLKEGQYDPSPRIQQNKRHNSNLKNTNLSTFAWNQPNKQGPSNTIISNETINKKEKGITDSINNSRNDWIENYNKKGKTEIKQTSELIDRNKQNCFGNEKIKEQTREIKNENSENEKKNLFYTGNNEDIKASVIKSNMPKEYENKDTKQEKDNYFKNHSEIQTKEENQLASIGKSIIENSHYKTPLKNNNIGKSLIENNDYSTSIKYDNYGNESKTSYQEQIKPTSSSIPSSTSASTIKDSIVYKIIQNKNGLINLGNTCFMNTCLQTLIHCGPFISRLYNNRSSLKSLSKSFLDLCISQSESRRSSSPIELKQKFSKKHSDYYGYQQQDTQEFMRYFLEDISQELNTVIRKPPYREIDTKNKTKKQLNREYHIFFIERENSIIIDTFYGQLVNTFTCKCGFESFSFEKYLEIPLELEGYSSQKLDSLLKSFFDEEETLKWITKCEQCNKKEWHTKTVKMASMPEVLLISLKRWKGRYKEKNNVGVKFNDILDLKAYADKECIENITTTYQLIGVSNHSGSLSFGHYYAYVNLISQGWYEFNDSSCWEYNMKYETSTAYVLMYQRVDTLNI